MSIRKLCPGALCTRKNDCLRYRTVPGEEHVWGYFHVLAPLRPCLSFVALTGVNLATIGLSAPDWDMEGEG